MTASATPTATVGLTRIMSDVPDHPIRDEQALKPSPAAG
jgi:hypothetical protein